jgi:NitT/TauT family transport system permease protein
MIDPRPRAILTDNRAGDENVPAAPSSRRMRDIPAVRRTAIVGLICAGWQGYAMWLADPLILPSFTATLDAWWQGIVFGELPTRTYSSLGLLLKGYAVGVAIAALLSMLAISSRLGDDLLAVLTGMFNSLPGIALLPLALMWFGLGAPSMIFVLAHSVLWPLALNAHTGFRAVPETLRLVGRNYGLGRLRLILSIMLPAAFPAILGGLRIGWAFAWRTLIAAELVFGVSAGSGGLGWYIYIEQNRLETANVFAGLLTVVVIGLAMEAGFRMIETRTVERWGMQRR